MTDLAYELRKCTECSCSRCVLAGTSGCYVEVAIKELRRYEQAMDSLNGTVCAPEYFENP
jgi:hypothetical protein